MAKKHIFGGIRRLDDLGRFVIPKEIRDELHLIEGDALEISLVGSTIHVKKYSQFSQVLTLADALQECIAKEIKNVEMYDGDNNEKIESLKSMNANVKTLINQATFLDD